MKAIVFDNVGGPDVLTLAEVSIGKTLPLAQAAEAHRHLESRQSMGKLILVP